MSHRPALGTPIEFEFAAQRKTVQVKFQDGELPPPEHVAIEAIRPMAWDDGSDYDNEIAANRAFRIWARIPLHGKGVYVGRRFVSDGFCFADFLRSCLYRRSIEVWLVAIDERVNPTRIFPEDAIYLDGAK